MIDHRSEPLPARANFLYGNFESKWVTKNKFQIPLTEAPPPFFSIIMFFLFDFLDVLGFWTISTFIGKQTRRLGQPPIWEGSPPPFLTMSQVWDFVFFFKYSLTSFNPHLCLSFPLFSISERDRIWTFISLHVLGSTQVLQRHCSEKS